MRRIDELFMKYPFYGSRQMVRQLRRDGVCVGRHRVRRLMRLIGLEAIYQAPRTSVPHPMHRIYPYLLKGMAIDQPNRVWCADITYIPVQRGFLYLVAIMDWATRHVLSWRLSNTMDAGFCAEALGDALARHGQPEIFNTDQGSQFTSLDFTGVLKNASIRISMDGRGRCMDNIFIERAPQPLNEDVPGTDPLPSIEIRMPVSRKRPVKAKPVTIIDPVQGLTIGDILLYSKYEPVVARTGNPQHRLVPRAGEVGAVAYAGRVTRAGNRV